LSFVLCLLSNCLFARFAVYIDSATPKKMTQTRKGTKKNYTDVPISFKCVTI
jgi:hypothetical protein